MRLCVFVTQGTAVNVQAMAFGNMGVTSGTGVCFTRNPSTGERKLYGEYLINAQVCTYYAYVCITHCNAQSLHMVVVQCVV